MKKLTFKVSSPKNCSVVSLIKEVNKISCRIYLDLENNFVAIENVNDTMIDTIIELVNNYYTILGVDIDNIFEEQVVEPDITVMESAEETVEAETDETAPKKQQTILEPQSEDDLIIKKVEFENEHVENRINAFLKTAYWALYNRSATEKEIDEYILTCMAEISMRYSSKPIIEFSLGDIVDVNYGAHLPGEITGGHVHSIVCHILDNNLAYVLPISKQKTNIITQSSLPINTPDHATYYNEYYKGGTVLLDKGRYVRIERFNSVIGKTTSDYFEILLYQLASAFDFTDCLVEEVEEPFEEPSLMDEPADEVVEAYTTEEETSDPIEEQSKTSDAKSPAKKTGGEESALLECIGIFLDKLDKSKSVAKQVESFMSEIGMSADELVAQSFVIACDIKKINYENVILELHKLDPNTKEDIIKANLKKSFKSWLEQYPTLAEKCPKLSLMSVLKVFAKRFS